MDIKEYKDKKELGLAKVIEANKDGVGYAISTKEWERSTGAVLPDTVNAISVTDLTARKTELLLEIASIDLALKDCAAVKVLTAAIGVK